MPPEYWIIYHLETGEPLIRGSGQPGTAALQPVPEGCGLVTVPQKTVAQPELDLDALRFSLMTQIDAEAERLRMRYLTPGAGQGMTYLRKETEARTWTADNDTPTPFLSPEATARGMTVAALAAEVIARADQWATIGGAIEGLRMGAKEAILTAVGLTAIVEASSVEWPQ